MAVIAKDDNLQIDKLELGPFGVNAYIITCLGTGDSVLIDTPAETGTIIEALRGTNPKYILLTHNHMDHTGALTELHNALKVPLGIHTLDAGNIPSPPDMLLNDGDNISVGNLNLEVLHTPGHTPGSVCFKVGNSLIAGDTIFPGGPGKTRTPDNFHQIITSITEKILTLPDNTALYPGHGDITDVAKAKEEYAVFSSRPHDADLCGDVLWLSS